MVGRVRLFLHHALLSLPSSFSFTELSHSESVMENQAVSLFWPLMIMCCLNTPSNVNPSLIHTYIHTIHNVKESSNMQHNSHLFLHATFGCNITHLLSFEVCLP